ncbi:hypothetical protein NQ317_008035 [Molorchus minor]|uniref:Integrase zinc-binding domain-containing protein n=1 Tax=Molorchus minor TaxID=1323400 RepID=A0ABQ9JRL2_9CUCU|nr:hypothetical protein NQ317_008035 [Molorchus minor]
MLFPEVNINLPVKEEKDDPLGIVKGIPLSGPNYSIAYATLCKRYQNKRIQCTHSWNEIINSTKIDSENPQRLRHLLDLFEENLVKRFELHYSPSDPARDIPTYHDLTKFLEKQCASLDSAALMNEQSTSKCKQHSYVKQRYHSPASFLTHSQPSKPCLVCHNGHHSIEKCSVFLICFGNHQARTCNSKQFCATCNRKHSTLLHFANPKVIAHDYVNSQHNNNANSAVSAEIDVPTSSQVNVYTSLSKSTTVLLSTATVAVLDCRGAYQSVRTLLDSASQSSFITEKCLARLGLRRKSISTSIYGLSQMSSKASGVSTCTICPIGSISPVFEVDLICLPNICANLPAHAFSLSDFPHISNLKLADGTFNKPGPVDILLGADVFSLILQNGRIAGSTPDEPIAINTVFGWIVMGKIAIHNPNPINSFFTSTFTPLDEILKRFWEIEQVPNKPSISVEDSLCEKIYQDTVSRNASGDAIIKILAGLKWLPSLDVFSYYCDPKPNACTKRAILSEIARIFDPLGFLSPIIFFTKYLIQCLWILGIDWDQSVPADVYNKWLKFHFELNQLKGLQIPRRIMSTNISSAELHSFCDASERGFAASSPHRWKQFVANRVAQIQEKICPAFWHYIPSLNNPADCASRGIFPSQLVNHSQWWAGPDFLYSSVNIDFFDEYESPECPEEIKPFVLTSFTDTDSISDLLNKWSSLSKIKRILSYCLRFIASCRKQRADSDYITSVEMHNAVITLAKVTQKEFFSQEILNLKRSRPLIKPLRRLNPFLDDSGVIRVGGRLRHSSLDYPTKHPILLPRQSRLTELLVEEVHRDNFHPGLQTTHFLLLQNFWILSPKRAIRTVLSKCLRCFRVNPSPISPPKMGDLPSFRVNQLKAFSHVGVDMGGPFYITPYRQRGGKILKAYLCLFVCCVTRALHLELTSDLSAESFLAALRRLPRQAW